MQIINPSDNYFETLMVDITHRCNMHCNNCYLPNRDIADMDIPRLLACLKQLPKRTNIRLAGGEPTLRHDLPEIITSIKQLGHRVVLLTNGLRLAQESYVNRLHQAGLRHVYISFNGADKDHWYQQIDQLACAQKKQQAIHNVLGRSMILNTGTILIKGVNEDAVQRTLDIIGAYQPRHALLRFKNIGALGRYDKHAEQHNLNMDDMQQLVANATGLSVDYIAQQTHIAGKNEPNTRLFPAHPNTATGQGIWIKITDWQADTTGLIDPNSSRRGRVTADFKLAPFFEHIKHNEGGF